MYYTLTVRVELLDDGLYDSGALGDMSPAYWHAVTGGITHRASPPYSHVSGHAGAAGRVCGRPTALATGITGIRWQAVSRSAAAAVSCFGRRRRTVVVPGRRTVIVVPERLLAQRRRRRRRSANVRVRGVAAIQLARAMLDERRRVGVARHCSCRRPPTNADSAAAGHDSWPPIAPESYRTIYNTGTCVFRHKRRRDGDRIHGRDGPAGAKPRRMIVQLLR